jgi:hypothetical protein
MNIVPGLHLALVSVPKLADTGYTSVLTKYGTEIYDDNTTAITASNPPILESDWCQDTGLWRLNLNPDDKHATPETINVIFDLPSSHETFLWYNTHQRDSHQTKHLLTPSATETTQHGQN